MHQGIKSEMKYSPFIEFSSNLQINILIKLYLWYVDHEIFQNVYITYIMYAFVSVSAVKTGSIDFNEFRY
jgi:hypothetical protein